METREFRIGNMDCAGCAREVESAVKSLEGVKSADVNFMTNTLHLIGDVDFDRLKVRVEAVGKTINDGEEPAETKKG